MCIETLIWKRERAIAMSRPIDAIIKILTPSSDIQLHEVDIENLAGSGLLNAAIVRSIRDRYLQTVPGAANALILVAAGVNNREAVYNGWPGAIYVFRRGANGADLALIDVFDDITDYGRFNHVYLASGDGGLAVLANKAKQLGIGLTVVTQRGGKSWRLNGFPSIHLTKNLGVIK